MVEAPRQAAPGGGRSWRDIAQVLAELDRHAAVADPAGDVGRAGTAGIPHDRTYDALVAVAADRIPGAEWVSVTIRRGRTRFTTVAASHPHAARADAIQYRLGSGPCVDAITDGTIYCPQDIAHDPHWPRFGREVSGLGVASMLAYRMSVDGGGVLGCLNIYSTEREAFDDDAITLGEIVATHAALLVSDRRSRDSVEQLRGALESNREIGMAMGVLMQRYKVSRNEALDLLRLASQNGNRKLRDVAADVTETGELTLQRPARRTS